MKPFVNGTASLIMGIVVVVFNSVITRLLLRVLEGFINSLFWLLNVPLKLPDYSRISKCAKTVLVRYQLVAHQVIDSTRLKVFGEGEWKTRKHGKEKSTYGCRCTEPCCDCRRSQSGSGR